MHALPLSKLAPLPEFLLQHFKFRNLNMAEARLTGNTNNTEEPDVAEGSSGSWFPSKRVYRTSVRSAPQAPAIQTYTSSTRV